MQYRGGSSNSGGVGQNQSQPSASVNRGGV